MSVYSTVCGVEALGGRRPCHSLFRHQARVGLATGANDVYDSAFNLPISFWKP